MVSRLRASRSSRVRIPVRGKVLQNVKRHGQQIIIKICSKPVEYKTGYFAVLQAMKIIGESNIPAERVKELVKGEEFAVLVVTPQIINNYFQMSSSASITDFTLLVFDEFHHAKKDHPYNELIKRCLLSGSDAAVKIPQVCRSSIHTGFCLSEIFC